MDKLKKFMQTLTGISDNEFEDAKSNFIKVDLKKGEFFAQKGKTCRNIGYISSGILRTFYLNDKGEEITSCFCTKNSLTTSYKSFTLQQPSSLSIQALEDSQLFTIDFYTLQKLYSKSMVWQNIGRVIAEKEYFVMEQYASVLNNESAKEKYLRLLNEQPEVIQKASVEDIASYLGVTRRTLSRIRHEIIK